MKNTKKISSLFFIFLLMLSFLTGCESQSEDKESIQEIMSQFQTSINAENLDSFIDCMHPDTITSILSAMDSAETLGYSKDEISADIFGRFSAEPSSVKFDVKNITFSDSNKKASADVTLTASDTEAVTSTINFIKDGDKWYINGENMI